MMYNQQFPMGAGGAFPGAPNPNAMMASGAGAGPAGMMQNTAMPQLTANGQSKSVSLLTLHTSPYSLSSLYLSTMNSFLVTLISFSLCLLRFPALATSCLSFFDPFIKRLRLHTPLTVHGLTSF